MSDKSTHLHSVENAGAFFPCSSLTQSSHRNMKSTKIEWTDKTWNPVTGCTKHSSATPYHRYQLLTKCVERMAEYFSDRTIPSNVWLGVTVESSLAKYRIDYLRKLSASIKFLSCEPLLESLGNLNLDNIDWVIVGGESGPKARPMKEEWALQIQAQTERQGTAFFFKQWGTWGSDGVKRNKHANGKMIGGRIYQAMPA